MHTMPKIVHVRLLTLFWVDLCFRWCFGPLAHAHLKSKHSVKVLMCVFVIGHDFRLLATWQSVWLDMDHSELSFR